MAETFRQVKYFFQLILTGSAEGSGAGGGYDPQLKKIVELFTENKDVEKLLGSIPKAVEGIDNTAWSIKAIGGAIKEVAAVKIDADAIGSGTDMAASIQSAVNYIKTLFYGPSMDPSGKAGIVEVSRLFGENTDFVNKGLSQANSGLSALAMTIPNFFEQISAVSQAVTQNISQATAIQPEVVEEVAAKLDAIQQMVAGVQQLNNSMASLSKVKLQANLEKVASAVGLGGGGVYTVKTRDVNINIDLKVVMKAGDIESTILSASESKLKARINTLLDAVDPAATKANVTSALQALKL